ncbi:MULTISPECIES: asparagine synthase (glutamine-hydrolyzing) [Dyadobacter]|uniref:asparagine synthase (glutamine-hydrolyzing) n=1 Tax=Dyadobacter chenhuakuii TaxID=2909339 RepID=A0ABY4XKZ8_9BACT|nr:MULTISPECIES: asparagine synthase (glutamine-hydrolyzing) [Dyadobacter]MCF2493777.1 asparagine synthase (glutamine-hydrolyzing) [Dyadobacter chenhuakuii]MCF2518022.1 asparagine synthase (glutamine-hydrolyzing) [Dyadobacter sp. CY351]USJ30911.1 asparagine synthase (glutamine-hydrolyzing) [Dyadobacter chenhuakuii]
MCGIAGFIDYKQGSSQEILIKITKELHHRGPDASGHQIFDSAGVQIGIGHQRLAIIDLSDSGIQPMQFGDLWIVFNGEIYNYQNIKKELLLLGHHFTGHSDTEVILHAFQQWGISCVDKFIGMFAFVVYDAKARTIHCVRDRAGIKPFFYYWHDGLFLFASELKAFHKHPQFKKEINFDAVAAFMQHGHVPTPHCIFNYAYKLRPGHYLKLDIDSRALDIFKYWEVYSAYNKPKLDISFEEAKTETEKILKSAFEYRMVSDVPVGVFLSGGYDSACLTAILQKDRNERLKTFTIGVPDIGLNESEYAKSVADHLGTEHHEYSCTQKEALELISELPYYYDEPFGDQSAIPTMFLCKMTSDQVTVALSADGGDEVFAGYTRYEYIMKYGNALNRIPGFARKGVSDIMNLISADYIPLMKNKYNFHDRYEKFKSLLKDPSAKNMMLSISRQFDEEQISALLNKNVNALETYYTSEGLSKNFYSPLAYMMAVDYQTFLLDDVLQKVDRASMAFSLESREPFIDHRIIEWAAQLPDNYKYSNGVKKYILKEIVYKHIPKELMDRPKMGFQIPTANWLSTDLKNQVLYYLSDDNIASQGIFRLPAVQKLREGFFSGKKEYAHKIWYLLMFQMWYEKWMD